MFATPQPAALDLTEPGTEGYDFGKSYDLLRDRQQHYRDHAMWRGNLALTRGRRGNRQEGDRAAHGARRLGR